jgi:hypothetical protein
MPTRASKPPAARVKLPFFSLNRPSSDGAAPVECSEAAGYGTAFTSFVDATAYLQQQAARDLELSLIFRQSVAEYLEVLEHSGFAGVVFDPGLESAKRLSLAELRTNFS